LQTTACSTLLQARPRIDFLLAAILKIGWQIASATVDERAVLEAHGFGSGRVQ
jgi:hypothetical protein